MGIHFQTCRVTGQCPGNAPAKAAGHKSGEGREIRMKIYELTFTGTEKLFKIKEVNCLPKDAEVVPFNFNKPIYYSEKTGQYYYCDK